MGWLDRALKRQEESSGGIEWGSIVEHDIVRARLAVSQMNSRGQDRILVQIEQFIPKVIALLERLDWPGAQPIRVDYRFPRSGWLVCTWTDTDDPDGEVPCFLHSDGKLSTARGGRPAERWFDRRDPYWARHAPELLEGLHRLYDSAHELGRSNADGRT